MLHTAGKKKERESWRFINYFATFTIIKLSAPFIFLSPLTFHHRVAGTVDRWRTSRPQIDSSQCFPVVSFGLGLGECKKDIIQKKEKQKPGAHWKLEPSATPSHQRAVLLKEN